MAQKPSPHDPQAPHEPLLQVGGDAGVGVIVGVGVAIGEGVARAESGGQAAGAGAFFTPVNLPGLSFMAVEGGLPEVAALAAAQKLPPPKVSRSATALCVGSSSE